MNGFESRLAALIVAALLAGSSGAAGAASPAFTIERDASGSAIVRTLGDAAPVQPAALEAVEAGHVIFSNFSHDPDDLYYWIGGWGVLARHAGLGQKQAVAMGFTPKADATLSAVRLALKWGSGTNAVMVLLQEDDHGYPGRVMRHFALGDLEGTGTCCATARIHGRGVPLVAGRQYWIAVRAMDDTSVAWDFSYDSASRPYALDSGDGWKPGTNVQSAFAVIGE